MKTTTSRLSLSTATPDDATPFAEPTPGWSNAPADGGISTRETPAAGVDMGQSGWSNNGPAATGATAGTPGAFTPTNADTPNKLSLMSGVTAVPVTAWTTGQYVVLGDGSLAHWSSTAWVIGKA